MATKRPKMPTNYMAIHMSHIKIEDLKAGYLYRISARNASYGIWIPEKESFAISRIKFGNNYIFEENHWDAPVFATVKPLEEIEQSPFRAEDIKIYYNESEYFGYNHEDEMLKYLNKFEGDR